VVLVSIDTLRADHLPAWGHTGVKTPAIDALRLDSILFENAYAHVPLTLPSHASVFTGLLPYAHGVRDNLGYRLDARAHPTLAALLRAQGYATGGAVSAYVLRTSTGIAEGFDFYDDRLAATGQPTDALGEVQRAGGETADRLLAWREASARGRPSLLFLHLFEPHAPYEPPPAFASAPSAYDGEIAAVDAVVGRFLERLKADGSYDRSIVVLFSDHGEGLGEHGEKHHGVLLYRWALHVPLLVKLPRAARAGTTVSRPVGLVDLLPTVLGQLGLPVPEGLPGRSLLDEADTARPQYAETFYPRIHLGWSELRSLLDDRHHWIDGPRPELYDVRADARELDDLAAREPAAAERLRSQFALHPAGFAAPAPADRETREQLAALGYLAGGPAAAASGSLPNPRDRIGSLADVEEAFRLAKAEDPRAVAAFRRLLEANPRQLDVQLGLAELLARLERYPEAREAYLGALALAPAMRGEIGLALARVCLVLGHADEIESHARAGLEVDPAQGRELLAWAALARGDAPAAETEARSALVLAPGAAGSALALAEALVRGGDTGQALAVLEGARARAKEPVRGLEFARGDLLARLGRHADAAAAFEQEIRSFPTNADAYARLAIVYAIEGRTRAEVARLVDAMHAASPGPRTAALAAETFASIGDTVQAERWRRRAKGASR